VRSGIFEGYRFLHAALPKWEWWRGSPVNPIENAHIFELRKAKPTVSPTEVRLLIVLGCPSRHRARQGRDHLARLGATAPTGSRSAKSCWWRIAINAKPRFVSLQDLQPWQTLIGSAVAFLAIAIAYLNTGRTLAKTQNLEEYRRARKLEALRAILPLALSEVCQYAEIVCQTLMPLVTSCANRLLIHDGMTAPKFPLLPPDAIKSLSDFIEYADDVDVQLLVALVHKLQILKARLSGLVSKMADSTDVTQESWLESLVIDCAVLYARAAAAFEFSRGEKDDLPPAIAWDNVRAALRNMGLWEDELPGAYKRIDQYEAGKAAIK
jgi:hypothetical protein